MALLKGKSTQYLMWFSTVLCLVTLGCIAVIVYMKTHEHVPGYGGLFSYQGKRYMRHMIPLGRPVMNPSILNDWVEQAATSAYTFDFANYQSQLAATTQKYFTSEGATGFMNALEASKVLGRVVNEQLSVTAVVTGTPVVLRAGFLNGVYSWKLQLPLLVTYQSASAIQNENLMVTMLVVLESTARSPKGVGIQQFLTA